MGSENKIKTFKEFWPYYVSAHTLFATQLIHVIGTISSFCLGIYLIYQQHWLWLGLCPIMGYGFAWYSHFFIEKNRPATFEYAYFSFIGDLKMIVFFLSGRMGAEVIRLQKPRESG